MGISSPGIGSNLPIDNIIAKLMQAESLPLNALAKKEASYQAKLSGFGNLSGTLSAFQNAIATLNNQSTFKAMTATPSDASIFTASSTAQATPGSYSINVTQLAQAQAISSAGVASTTATIGTGASTKLTFQFGAINGSITSAGAKLNSTVAAGGIAPSSLTINGTTITTGTSTNSANALAAQINLATGTTGVTATAQATDTGALGAFTTTTGPYRLDVDGINIVNDTGAAGIDAATLDSKLSAASSSLTAAGIAYTGSAAAGNLKFTRTDGSNIAVQESGTGATGGFATTIGIGNTKTFTSSVSLSSANTITVGGSNPAAAGLTAGTFSTYLGATFSQDPNQPSGSVTIDNTNNSLQGIRDAINKANLGVTASIVSDGSNSPYHLVLKSNKTGETSSMKIDVAGSPDLAALLAYDPAGTQNMKQTSAAQSSKLTVNGIAVTSQTNSISGAIEGISLDVSKLGAANLTVARNTATVTQGVQAFVKAYNELNSTIKKLSSYDPGTKTAGVLFGDSSVRNIEMQVRKMLASPAEGSNSTLRTLSQVGISIDKTGVMSLDAGKLTTAMNKDLTDVAALFSSVGKTSDSLVSFVSASSSLMPGEQEVFVQALATQGNAVGSKNLLATPPATIDSTNRDLSLTIDGVTTSVSLTPGTYTSAQIAAQVQSTINGASAFSSAGIAVSVKVDSVTGIMSVTSNKYGSESKVSISGSAVANLFNTTTETAGKDVKGSIGGVPATGSGQFLTGASGSPAAGLKLQITGGAEGASRGTITFSQGQAFHLNKLIEGFLGDNGVIAGRTNGINSSIKDIGRMNDSLTQRLTATEARYRAQFTALDVMVSKMNSTSTYLTQQLAQISNLSKQ